MKKNYRVAATELRPGMTFELFQNKCFVVFAKPNKFGLMIVRFVMDTSTCHEVYHMVVPKNLNFKIQLR